MYSLLYIILQHTIFFFLFLRILCETVKDFVAKVGKAYEKSAENVDECDTMSLKVSHKNKAFNIDQHALKGNTFIY